MHKLSHFISDSWEPYSHRAVYRVTPQEGAGRILAGIPGGVSLPFVRLVGSLEPPYFLLYVLHTPRGEGEAGRYQSPPLSQAQFQGFMQRFGAYLSSDARCDIWAHSAQDQATVVWDRHNQLFAYGPLARYCAELDALGFTEGDASIPVPHQHHYRQEFDAEAKEILESLPWTFSPLQPEDEQ